MAFPVKKTGEMVYLLLFLLVAFLIFSTYLKRNVHGVILELLKLVKTRSRLTGSKQCVADSKVSAGLVLHFSSTSMQEKLFCKGALT